MLLKKLYRDSDILIIMLREKVQFHREIQYFLYFGSKITYY